MVGDAVGADQRIGDGCRLYAEIYAIRLEQDLVTLARNGRAALPVALSATLPGDGVDVPTEGADPTPRWWRHRR